MEALWSVAVDPILSLQPGESPSPFVRRPAQTAASGRGRDGRVVSDLYCLLLKLELALLQLSSYVGGGSWG